MSELKIGSCVTPKIGQLRSGCEAYPYAIVVNLDPLQLMSIEGDMFWSCSFNGREDTLEEVYYQQYLPDSVISRMHREGLKVPQESVNPEEMVEWCYSLTINDRDVDHEGSGTVKARNYDLALYKIKNLFPASAIIKSVIKKR